MTTGLFSRAKALPLAVAVSLTLCGAAATAGPVLLSFTGGSNFPAFNGTQQTIGFTFNGSARSGSSTGFAAPLTIDCGNGRFGPNFQYTANAVPEPSTLLIVLTSLGLLGASRVRAGRAA